MELTGRGPRLGIVTLVIGELAAVDIIDLSKVLLHVLGVFLHQQRLRIMKDKNA